MHFLTSLFVIFITLMGLIYAQPSDEALQAFQNMCDSINKLVYSTFWQEAVKFSQICTFKP
uniref:Uncharacterized protein n=2 Tax=gambiae species complex TaxID=44542 RepID=A0A2C9H3R0_ANOGA